MPLPYRLRELGQVPYQETWRRMQAFTGGREANTPDEIWLLEHPPVFTLGMNSSPEHVLEPDGIPLVQSDRGGQVTYHGPGQLVAYVLMDIRRATLGVRDLVTALEQSVIAMVGEHGIQAVARQDAPGVYVADRKLASLGIRIRRGCSYHGLAINVDMDLSPFAGIDPCGYPGLEVTSLAELGISLDVAATGNALVPHLVTQLGLDPGAGGP